MGRGQSQASLEIVETASTILKEIQPATVRAVCYRLFTTGLIRNMSKNETNKISRLLTIARNDGTIPWEWIVDETRDVEHVLSWDNPAAFAKSMQRWYRRDRWQEQASHVEVWSEKGTVRGTIKPVLDEYGVDFRVMHGYGSTTAIHNIAEDIRASDKPWTVFYIGDWDPSGLGMSEQDLPTRLATEGIADWAMKFSRLALNKRDIANHALPGFAATTKIRDPRYAWYADRYGNRCWELDAMSPVVLRNRVKSAIVAQIEPRSWARAGVCEAVERESIIKATTGWNHIAKQQSL